MTAQFDHHSDSYRDEVDASVRFTGQDVDFFARRKADELLASVRRLLGDPAGIRALDIGCGVGVTDGHLATSLRELHGVDVSAEAVVVATEANPTVRYQTYDGSVLPFEAASFDLAFAICVLHHVEPADRRAFTAEAARVVKPGGLVVIFEHNPINPLTRVAVSRCEFDEGVQLLRRRESERLLEGAGLTVAASRYLLFVPVDAAWAHRIDRSLAWLPLGGQHQVVGRGPADRLGTLPA